VARSCSAEQVDAALDAGSVVRVEWHEAPALALAEVADTEEMLADGLAALAAENRLAVVVGADADQRTAVLERALGGLVEALRLDDAHRLDQDAVLAAVEDLPEQVVLALCLDNALPLGPGPGAVALDLATAGACPVLVAERRPDRHALDAARREVAAGRWPSTDPADRTCVEVVVSSPEEALVRVRQLVATSIPRAFDRAGADIVVLLADGSLDPAAVRDGCVQDGGAPTVARLDEAEPDRWPAAVVVLAGPGAPVPTRAALYAGLRAGAEHVSLVHGLTEVDTRAAVLAVADRPRRTRLVDLLGSE
jgi:hypothetical protein